MDRIVVAFSHEEAQRRILRLLESAGCSPAACCVSGGETIRTVRKLGGAVVRNRARRRLRELFRLSQGRMVQGYDVLLVARGRTARIPHRYLRRDYETALKKLGLVSEEGAEK